MQAFPKICVYLNEEEINKKTTDENNSPLEGTPDLGNEYEPSKFITFREAHGSRGEHCSSGENIIFPKTAEEKFRNRIEEKIMNPEERTKGKLSDSTTRSEEKEERRESEIRRSIDAMVQESHKITFEEAMCFSKKYNKAEDHIYFCRTELCKPMSRQTADLLFDYLLGNIPWTEGSQVRGNGRSQVRQSEKNLILNINDPLLYACKDILYNSVEHTKPLWIERYNIHKIKLNLMTGKETKVIGRGSSGEHHLIIALGATRTIKIRKKTFHLSTGEGIFCGSIKYLIPAEEVMGKTIFVNICMRL